MEEQINPINLMYKYDDMIKRAQELVRWWVEQDNKSEPSTLMSLAYDVANYLPGLVEEYKTLRYNEFGYLKRIDNLENRITKLSSDIQELNTLIQKTLTNESI